MICGSGANPNSPSSGCPKRSKTHEPPKGSTGRQNCCLPAPKTTGVRDGHLVPTSDSRDFAMSEWRHVIRRDSTYVLVQVGRVSESSSWSHRCCSYSY